MKKTLLFMLLVLGLLVAGCTPNQGVTEEEQLEQDREIIEEQIQEFLEQQDKEQQEFLTPKDGESAFDEQDLTELNEEEIFELEEREEEKEEPEEVIEEKEEEEPVNTKLDIDVLDIDVRGNTNYDINDPDDEDREVTFEVILDVDGLKDGENFLVEVTAIKRGDRVDACQLIFIQGETSRAECIMDNFEEYGDYDLEVYADEREKFDEVDEDNNFFRDEFELEED